MAGGVPLEQAMPYTCWIILVCSGYLLQVDGFTNGYAGSTPGPSTVAMTKMDMGLWIALGMSGLIILILTLIILLIVFRKKLCRHERDPEDPEDILGPEELPKSIDRKPSADNIYDELPEEEDSGYDAAVLPSDEERPPSYRTATRRQNVPTETENVTTDDPLNLEPTLNGFPPGHEDMVDMSRHSSYDNIPGMGLEAYEGLENNENDEESNSPSTKADDNHVNDDDVTSSVDPVYAVIDKTKKKKNRDSEMSGSTELGEEENGIQPPSLIDSAISVTETSPVNESTPAEASPVVTEATHDVTEASPVVTEASPVVTEASPVVTEVKQSRVKALIASLQSS